MVRPTFHPPTVHEMLCETHRDWIDGLLNNKPNRQAFYSESLAVGSEKFIEKVKQSLGIRATGRQVKQAPEAGYQLKESIAMYGSTGENDNSCFERTNNPDMKLIRWR